MDNEPNYVSEMIARDGGTWKRYPFWALTHKVAVDKFEQLWMAIHKERVGGQDIALMRLSSARSGKTIVEYRVDFDDIEGMGEK
jgi:hypothetical protein